MGRKEDLEQNIRESYELIGRYEEILRLSSDPKEKTRAQRTINEQRGLIEEWTEEYLRLGGSALPDHMTDIAGSPPESGTVASPASGSLSVEPQKPVPWLGYFFVALLGLDLVLIVVLGWRFLSDQPALLSYLEVVIGILGLGSAVVLAVVAIQRKMSVAGILHWLGTNRLLQVAIAVITIALLTVVLWPQRSRTSDLAPPLQPAGSQPAEVKTTPVITSTASIAPVTTRWAGPCNIESLEAEPPSPQPVGGLVIFKIRGTCESGVRAIRLLINDEWYDEKGGHIAPAEEFVPTWSTKDLSSGDYRITAEVATWRDDDWQFAASQTLTYTLIAPPFDNGNP